jgi:hypothetical protein
MKENNYSEIKKSLEIIFYLKVLKMQKSEEIYESLQ